MKVVPVLSHLAAARDFAVPPGVENQDPVDLLAPALERTPEPAAEQGSRHGVWTKALLGAMAATSALTGVAHAAGPAAVPVVASTLTQESSMRVTFLPPGTPRVDLVRQQESEYGHGRHEDRAVAYAPVGVDLGDGLFLDANRNLSFVPSLAYDWGTEVDSFRQIEMEAALSSDTTVSRFGNTVHYNPSQYRRFVYVEQGDAVAVRGREDNLVVRKAADGTVRVTDEEGLRFLIRPQGEGSFTVSHSWGRDATMTREGDSYRVRGDGVNSTVSPAAGGFAIRGTGSATVMRSADGAVTNVDGPLWDDANIVRQGNTIRVEQPGPDKTIQIDPAESDARARQLMSQLAAHLEQTEPGYAQRHPLIIAVLEYAVANPGLIGDEGDSQELIQAGTALATAGGAIKSGTALMVGAQALTLAENARALGAAALAAKAAAQSAAQAGNLTQAAALASEAQNLAGRAREIGAEAMRNGQRAQNAASVARVMLGVAGTLEIIDGGFDLHEGYSDRSIIDGAVAVTEANWEILSQRLTGQQLERAREDYTKVMQVLQSLDEDAGKQITVGGLKVGCGGLMLISALMGGGVIPPIVGAVGIACTIGTSAYEHWDAISAFFTGEEAQDPEFLDILPDSQNIIIDLN